MRFFKYLSLSLLLSLISIQCTSEKATQKSTQKTTAQVLEQKPMALQLHISGMTCEIGCARTIQSKLSKKEGVLDAKVIFTDSIAKINYNANAITSTEIISFINGIAGGDMYTASELKTVE